MKRAFSLMAFNVKVAVMFIKKYRKPTQCIEYYAYLTVK